MPHSKIKEVNMICNWSLIDGIRFSLSHPKPGSSYWNKYTSCMSFLPSEKILIIFPWFCSALASNLFPKPRELKPHVVLFSVERLSCELSPEHTIVLDKITLIKIRSALNIYLLMEFIE